MKKTSILYALLAVIGISSLCVIAVGALSILNLQHLSNSFRQFTNTQTPIVRSTQQALLSLEEASTNIGFVLSIEHVKDIEEVRLYEAGYNKAILQFEMFVSALQWGSDTDKFRNLNGGIVYSEWKRHDYDKKYHLPPASGTLSSEVQVMSGSIDTFVRTSQEIFSLRKKILRQSSGDSDQDELHEKLHGLIEEMRSSKKQISQSMQAFIAESDASVDSEMVRLEQLASSLYILVLAIIGINVVISVLFGLYYTRIAILQPIQKLTQVVDGISKGKLDVRIDPKQLESRNEIGDLARAFDRTVVSLKLAMREKGTNEKPEDQPKTEPV